MTDKHIELIQKAQALNEKETDLLREAKQVERLEEDYFQHFSKSNQLFADIRRLFQETDEARLFDELTHDVYRDSRKMEEPLFDMKTSASDQRHLVQVQLDEVSKEKQKLNAEEEKGV